MTDRPIIMSAPMVCALLDGRKSQTRRVLSPRNTYRDGYPWSKHAPWDAHDWNDAFVDPGPSPAGNPGPYLKVPFPEGETRHRIYPLFWPGDRLWVREAWRAPYGTDWLRDDLGRKGRPSDLEPGSAVDYLATDDAELCGPTYPSIFMPRWASRLTLLVTNVRIERLQDISEDDAKAEGAPDYAAFLHTQETGAHDETPEEITSRLRWPQRWYADLWNTLHGPGSWSANPWVAAFTFTVTQANIDTLETRAAA